MPCHESIFKHSRASWGERLRELLSTHLGCNEKKNVVELVLEKRGVVFGSRDAFFYREKIEMGYKNVV